jgi:uroporphyrinogen-III synthase
LTASLEFDMQGRNIAILESRVGEHLVDLVTKYGGKPFWAPALAEVPDIDLEAIRELIEGLAADPPQLFVFQTGVGTKALFDACDRLGVTAALSQALAAATVAARGPKPTVELRRRGVRIDLSAAEPYTTTEVLQAIAHLDLREHRVLVQRYGESNAELDQALTEKGARFVEIPTYRWALPSDTSPLIALMDALQRSEIDAVVFTSASQIRNLFTVAAQAQRESQLRQDLNRTLVASIGPTCSRALAANGVKVGLEAHPPKLGPLFSQLQALFASA